MKGEDTQALIAVGEDARYIAEGAAYLGKERVLHYETREALEKDIDRIIRPTDIILVKASRGMEMEKTVNKILKDK